MTAPNLQNALEVADIHTDAEGFGFDDAEAVSGALAALRVEPVTGPDAVRIDVRYRAGTSRPVRVHFWDSPDAVAELVNEARTELETAAGAGVARVRTHLLTVSAVVALELGGSQLSDLGVVFASRLSTHIAEMCDGLIRDPDDTWWAISKRVPVKLFKVNG